ncbi:MAG: glycosyltransferase family 4 protein [Myxococcales bacterium]|nr:glycosyltransferase family 4 protein [Myxococcales bacterium]
MRTALVDLTPFQTTHRLRGIGRYVHDLAQGLGAVQRRAREAGVRVLGVTWIDETGEGTVVEDLASLRPRGDAKGLDSADARVRYGRRMHFGAIARRVGADLVHLTDARGTPVLGPRRVVTCHDLIPLRFSTRYLGWQDGFAPIRRLRELHRYGGADHVIAISEETRRDLRRLLEVPDDRISVVHNGIDLARFSAEPAADDAAIVARYGLERPYFVYVGAWEWRKNAEGMFGALAHARAHGTALELAFVGNLSAGERGRLEALAESVGVQGQVRALGFVPDEHLPALYRRSLGHVLVSFAEGFGLTLVEAMACGAPLVATAGSSLAEVAGDAGLLVPPDDTRAIGEAMVRLAEQSALRAQLRERGLVRAREFSRERFAERTLAVYARLLA